MQGHCALRGVGEGVMARERDDSKNNMLFILSPQASKIFR